jgi:hypothetical protein
MIGIPIHLLFSTMLVPFDVYPTESGSYFNFLGRGGGVFSVNLSYRESERFLILFQVLRLFSFVKVLRFSGHM